MEIATEYIMYIMYYVQVYYALSNNGCHNGSLHKVSFYF